MTSFKSANAPTVAQTFALAEAWNERAALLSTMAFELTSAFGALDDGGEPPYLIKRLTGGATAANPAHLEEIQLELFAAAKEARDQARFILSTAANACSTAGTTGLSRDEVNPPVDYGAIEIPCPGDEIAANPRCPASRRKLGDGPFFFEEEEQEEQRDLQVVAIHPDGPPPRGRQLSVAKDSGAHEESTDETRALITPRRSDACRKNDNKTEKKNNNNGRTR